MIGHLKVHLHTSPDLAHNQPDFDNPVDPEAVVVVVVAGNTPVATVAVADAPLKEAHTSPSSNHKPQHPYTHPSRLLSIQTLHHHHHHRLGSAYLLLLHLPVVDPDPTVVVEVVVDGVDLDLDANVGSSRVVMMMVRMSWGHHEDVSSPLDG